MKLYSIIILLLCGLGAKAQLSFQSQYQIKNNSQLAVWVNYTVSCNKSTERNEAKFVTIPAGETYTVPAPYLNSARTCSDCDIHIEVTGLFGSRVVNSINRNSKYNEDDSFYNTSNNLKPVGAIIWEPTITNIW